jgi:fatty acid desaturase
MYLTIFLMAIPFSILHELEHDLIHNMYFKGQQWVQHIMFFFIWISKWSTNPWFRKIIHLRHHILSGQVEDIEERLIGLGLPFNFSRIMITFYPLTGSVLFPTISRVRI